MHYFGPDYISFFKDLAPNNHKGWFDQNRKRYEESVKKPFQKFHTDLTEAIKKIDPKIPKDLVATKQIFRINRDIRFSKDKTPYKLHMSAVVAPEGKKDHTNPGLYYEINPEQVVLYGGIYACSTSQLAKIRAYIASHLDAFQNAIQNPMFEKYYQEGILGGKMKRLPKELKNVAEKEPLMYNKSFYYRTFLSIDEIFENNLLERIIALYEVSFPVRNFLRSALNNEG